MKVKIPLAIVAVIVMASIIGYLLGTESGRQRRDVIMVKLGRSRAGADTEDAEPAAAE